LNHLFAFPYLHYHHGHSDGTEIKGRGMGNPGNGKHGFTAHRIGHSSCASKPGSRANHPSKTALAATTEFSTLFGQVFVNRILFSSGLWILDGMEEIGLVFTTTIFFFYWEPLFDSS
jgi:hypothetical protein